MTIEKSVIQSTVYADTFHLVSHPQPRGTEQREIKSLHFNLQVLKRCQTDTTYMPQSKC